MIARIIRCYGIQTETIGSLIDPELHDLRDLFPHSLIIQIQIRHALPESCFVVPVGIRKLCISALHIPAEAVILRIRTHRRIRFLSGRQTAHILSSFRKPRMLHRGMIQHQIQDHLHVPAVCFLYKPLKILHRPVLRIDTHVICYIVLVICR